MADQIETRAYMFEPEDMQALREINRAIYDDKPLVGDRRRDLANRMDAILGHAVAMGAVELTIESTSSVECPHCHWGFAPAVIEQHIREKHGEALQ